MKALQIDRKLGRLGLARMLASMAPATAAKAGPVELVRDDPPDLPGPDWVRLRPRLAGICGSDLATVHGHAGPYFESIVSFPFTLGHEIVADVVAEVGARRVVVIPVLHCAIRGIEPGVRGVRRRRHQPLRTDRLRSRQAGPADRVLLRDRRRLERRARRPPAAARRRPRRPVRRGRGDDRADRLRGARRPDARPAASVGDHRRRHGRPADAGGDRRSRRAGARAPIIAAKYPAQQRFARRARRRRSCEPDELARLVRSRSASLIAGDQLTGGVSQVFDCVGIERVDQPGAADRRPRRRGRARRHARRRSTSTSPACGTARSRLTGCYAYRREDFDAAIELVRRFELGRLVSATYPLDGLRHGHRPRGQRRPPRRGQDRLRHEEP